MFNMLQAEYGPQGFTILGISDWNEDATTVREFVEKQDVRYRNVWVKEIKG